MRYLVLVSILWSFSFGIIKYGLSEVDPFFISYARNLIGLVFFASISIYQFKKFQWDSKLMLIGAIQFGLMYIFYIQSYQYLPAYLIATFTITTPIFISIADKYFFKNLITLRDALLIGVAQSFALIPGTSRSGVTITAGLFLGLDNKTASKFSFLMAVPTIGAIAAYQLFTTDVQFLIQHFDINLLGLIISFIIAYVTIDFFIKFINRIGFLPFILYRIILGAALFSLILQ